MLRRIAVTAAVIFAASAASAAERLEAPAASQERDNPSGVSWSATSEAAARLSIGDPAPAFSYMGTDGGWHGFRQLFAQGPVLLVFGARDEDLTALERSGKVFSDLGVRPVAVLDMRPGSAARLVRRLNLDCAVVADPQCVIGGLYSSLDPLTRQHSPSYFVLDGRGMIRGSGRGRLPATRQLVAISARSLGRPMPESVSTISKR